MKRALLIGVGDAQVDAGPNLDAMAALLSELGWTSTRLEGRVATRERILAELATLEHAITSQPEPDDALFFYYFGHGGAIYFTDCPGPIGERPVFYLCSARPRGAWEALLDVELTHALASIDRLCGNVSAVLDCCHSAQVVRDVELPSKPAPEWVRELSETQAQRHSDDGLLALESHPTIARLTGASSLRLAYYDRTTKLGNLSAGFVAVVRAANEADLLARVTWDALVHRVRAHVHGQRAGEIQWVSFAGPRERLLFSREHVDRPRTVGFVPGSEPNTGWLRAGALQGVELGDEWRLAELALDDDRQPRWCATVRVRAVDLNRAQVEGEGIDRLPAGTSAWPSKPADPDDRRSPAQRLLDALARCPKRREDLNLALTWGWFEGKGLRHYARPDTPKLLHVGDRLWVEVEHRGSVLESWFVSVLEIDVAGPLRLLSAREPEGVEIGGRQRRSFGIRPGRGAQGFERAWPEGLPSTRALPFRVLVLASQRPIELGHLVEIDPVLEWAHPRQEPGPRMRDAGPTPRAPEVLHGWGFMQLDFSLDPRPR